MKRNNDQPLLFSFGIKKIKNNEDFESESSNIQNIATKIEMYQTL
jgi:hypothetical protein